MLQQRLCATRAYGHEGTLTFMYPRDLIGLVGKVTGLYTYYSILNRLFRKTPTPRNGNPSDISSFAKNLMKKMQSDPRGGDFSVGDSI